MLLGLWFAAGPVAAGEQPSPWSIRIGGSVSSLEGALGSVYPQPAPGGTIGISFRSSRDRWRMRTGLDLASLAGWGHVAATETVVTPSGYSLTAYDVHEDWWTTWAEVPFVLEYLFDRRGARPYVGAGLTSAWRFAEQRDIIYVVSPEDARRFGASASATAGLEWFGGRGVRVELGFAHGLGALYDSADGPQGSWREWTIVLDAGL